MSRPTVALCMATIEAQDATIRALKDAMNRLNNRLVAVESELKTRRDRNSNNNSRPRSNGTGIVYLSEHAAAACKHFGVRSVTREQIEEYLASTK